MILRSISIALFLFASYISEAQVVTTFGLEQNEKNGLYLIPDIAELQAYRDSLSSLYQDELLTACVYSSLHELVPNVDFEYYLNKMPKGILSTDEIGRFYLTSSEEISEIRIRISHDEYYPYDSIFQIAPDNKSTILIELKPKYKILLRGRIYAGNLPLEGADIHIKHKEDEFNLSTLGCYTDDEDYWNCLYLGMFKQEITFEDPNDSLEITISKDGFKDDNIRMTMTEYDGTIISLRLRYANDLLRFPKHNIGLKFGHTFQKTWGVGVNYIYQLQIGKFDRLGIGLDATMLMNNITTQHTTFENLPDAEAETFYPIGMIGPSLNFSITKPTNRLLNLYAGIVTPYLLPYERIAVHPFVAGKVYLDINKAFTWEVKYIDYTINQAQYVFNPYGEAQETRESQDFQKVLLSLGLLVSF